MQILWQYLHGHYENMIWYERLGLSSHNNWMMADKLSLDELLEAELHDDNLISKSGREILESQYVLWVAGIMSK